MPIRRYINEGAFDPETTRAMGEAFSAVINRLEALGRGNPPKESIATFIINLAYNGEREAHRMTMTALTHFCESNSRSTSNEDKPSAEAEA